MDIHIEPVCAFFSSSDIPLILQIIKRPGVAGAVLQSPPLLINSLSDPLVQNLQDTVYPTP